MGDTEEQVKRLEKQLAARLRRLKEMELIDCDGLAILASLEARARYIRSLREGLPDKIKRERALIAHLRSRLWRALKEDKLKQNISATETQLKKLERKLQREALTRGGR